MAIYAPERIGSVSTEEIVTTVQTAILPRVLEAPQAPVPSDDGRQRYYAGENATALLVRQSGRLFVHYASLPVHLHDKAGNDPLEFTLGFGSESDAMAPLPLHDPESVSFTMSSMHSARRLRHQLTAWHDGGFSFEADAEVPSLDQLSIARMADFVDEMAATTLVLAKR